MPPRQIHLQQPKTGDEILEIIASFHTPDCWEVFLQEARATSGGVENLQEILDDFTFPIVLDFALDRQLEKSDTDSSQSDNDPDISLQQIRDEPDASKRDILRYKRDYRRNRHIRVYTLFEKRRVEKTYTILTRLANEQNQEGRSSGQATVRMTDETETNEVSSLEYLSVSNFPPCRKPSHSTSSPEQELQWYERLRSIFKLVHDELSKPEKESFHDAVDALYISRDTENIDQHYFNRMTERIQWEISRLFS